METIARNFIITSCQNQFVQENAFNNAPIRRIAVAMNTKSVVNTTSLCRLYVTTMKGMQFNEDFSALPMEDFQNHYILVFDLTSLQDAAEQLPYPELSGESLRLELFFQFPLEQVTEMIVFGERLSNIQKINSEQSLKSFNLFEFSGSYQKIVTFFGLFFVIVSVLSILFFFRPNAPEKIEKECFLVKNPRQLFNLDCKTVFKKLCPLHKACVWDSLLIQFLNVCKSLIFLFFIPKYTIKLSISLF